MAENGRVIRNGAEIQIDENGNVVARPAEGQEFIVEDDARVGTLEAGLSRIKNTSAILEEADETVNFDDAVETKTLWENVSVEQSEIVNVDLSNGEVTVLQDGLYQIRAQVQWDAGSTSWSQGDELLIRVFVNGSRERQRGIFFTTSSSDEYQTISCDIDLKANDTIDIRLQQNSGSDGANLIGFAPNEFFEVSRLG